MRYILESDWKAEDLLLPPMCVLVSVPVVDNLNTPDDCQLWLGGLKREYAREVLREVPRLPSANNSAKVLVDVGNIDGFTLSPNLWVEIWSPL